MKLPGHGPRRTATLLAAARPRRQLHGVRWGTLAYVPLAVGFMQIRRKAGVPRGASLAVATATPFMVARSVPAGRGRAVAVWLAHMWAYKVCFEMPYDRPEKLRSRLRIDPPIQADRVIGLGVPPGQRLQRRLRRPPILTALDKTITAVYLVWELEPHLALGWILWRHHRRFPAAALRLGATFDLTLVGYFLVPTAPPWWASEQEGRMDGDIRRVAVEVMRSLRGKSRPVRDHSTGANPWASMPSDHFATAVSTALLLSAADRRAGAVGWAYALALGGSLVYLGEHYVIDLLAGLTLALGVEAGMRACGDPLTRRLHAALTR